MKLSESPFMIFVRSMTLLAVLIALPGIAICWNHLPKNQWDSPKPTVPRAERIPLVPKESCESVHTIPLTAPETVPPIVVPAAAVTPALPGIAQTTPSEKKPMDASIQQTAWESPQKRPAQQFESLELRLKALGAKYYRLEKWGNRGELFRFSCFVTPSDRQRYEKYFQAIGSDEVTVMESVINDIEKWKNELSR